MPNTLVDHVAAPTKPIPRSRSSTSLVPPAWTDEDFRALEEAAGVSMPALMKEIYATPGAAPWFDLYGVDGYPGFAWLIPPRTSSSARTARRSLPRTAIFPRFSPRDGG